MESGPFTYAPNGFNSNNIDARSSADFDLMFGPQLRGYAIASGTFALNGAFAESRWISIFRVTGAPNTQVTYNFGIHLSDILATDSYGPSGIGVSDAHLTGIGAISDLSLADIAGNPPSSRSLNHALWKTMTFNVGDSVVVGGDLRLDATGQAGQGIADALSTGLFALQVVTPGGRYAAEPGVVFASSFDQTAPVSEPAISYLGRVVFCLFLWAGARKSQARRGRRG